MVLAIFDVDHTLVKCDSLKLFGLFIWRKKGIRIFRFFAFVVSLLRSSVVPKDAGELKASYLKMLCGGMPLIEVRALAREFAESRLRSKLYPQALAWIDWHKTQQHEVVLLSASLNIYLEALAEAVEAKKLICTKLLAESSSLTGDIQGLNCKGQEKLRRLLEEYREEDIDWSGSYAYSDSLSDLPILERVGNVVAVNPNSKLARIAVTRQWRIEHWK
jgi:HAD superfamily hydrolase (TIGR01490 family)